MQNMKSEFKFDPSFYNGKRVLVTGCTGFKGSWLCHMLTKLGAKVYGLALEPENESLFNILNLKDEIVYRDHDIRCFDYVHLFLCEAKPEIVFHLAAQPIVSEGYRDPILTYGTNVMGTVNLLHAVKTFPTARCIINVTTDKVY